MKGILCQTYNRLGPLEFFGALKIMFVEKEKGRVNRRCEFNHDREQTQDLH